MTTYKALQSALKDFRDAGYTLQVRLNDKKVKLLAELERLQALEATAPVANDIWDEVETYPSCPIYPAATVSTQLALPPATEVTPDPWVGDFCNIPTPVVAPIIYTYIAQLPPASEPVATPPAPALTHQSAGVVGLVAMVAIATAGVLLLGAAALVGAATKLIKFALRTQN